MVGRKLIIAEYRSPVCGRINEWERFCCCVMQIKGWGRSDVAVMVVFPVPGDHVIAENSSAHKPFEVCNLNRMRPRTCAYNLQRRGINGTR